jgi:hypothetical protein
VDPRDGLNDMEKWKFLTPPGLELRPLGRPARSQSLYRLSYRGSIILRYEGLNIVDGPRLISRLGVAHSLFL